MKKTLLYHSMGHGELATTVQLTVKELEEKGLVKKTAVGEFAPTLLGQAIVASSLTPEDGLFVHAELRKALQAFVIDAEMHVLYSFTPVQTVQTNINWQIFRKEVEDLSESNLRVLDFLCLKPLVIHKM
jgi:DNA polymerase theta